MRIRANTHNLKLFTKIETEKEFNKALKRLNKFGLDLYHHYCEDVNYLFICVPRAGGRHCGVDLTWGRSHPKTYWETKKELYVEITMKELLRWKPCK